MDHKVFKLGMSSDSVVFIINHTRRDYKFPTKVVGSDENGLVVQYYLRDVTLTFARRNGEYQIIEVDEPVTKEVYEAIPIAEMASAEHAQLLAKAIEEAERGKANGG